MSGDLQSFLKARAHIGETSLGLGVALSIVVHALVVVPFLLPRAGEEAPKEKITWVSLPQSAPSGPSGGAAGTEEGVEKNQRLRRADEVAPERPDAKAGSITQQDPFATKVSPGAIKGNNKDTTSKGTNTTAAKSATPSPVPQGGAAGAGNAGGIGAGEGIPGLKATKSASGGVGLIGGLEGDTFQYPYYLEQVQGRITANWNRLSSVQGRVQVYFRIRRDGQVERVRVEVPSPNEDLNASARMAVLRAAPLPPLPSGYEAEWLGVYMWFTYTGN
jgi:TonB family protein